MQGAETAEQFDNKLAAQHRAAALVESPNDSGFLMLLVLPAYLFCTLADWICNVEVNIRNALWLANHPALKTPRF